MFNDAEKPFKTGSLGKRLDSYRGSFLGFKRNQ